MERTYYRDQVLETIARKVLCAWKLISGGDEASEGACKA